MMPLLRFRLIALVAPAIAALAVAGTGTSTGSDTVRVVRASLLQRPGIAASLLDAAKESNGVAEHAAAVRVAPLSGAGSSAQLAGSTPANRSAIGPCPGLVANPLGVCPPLAIPSTRGRAQIRLCTLRDGLMPNDAAICGAGFHPKDAILLLAGGRIGTVAWRTTADSNGRFLSVLPAQVCRIAPATVVGSDVHGDRSNVVTVSASGC